MARGRLINLSDQERRIEAATRRMRPRLEQWIDKATEYYLRQFKTKGWTILRKSNGEDMLDKELAELLALFGSRQVALAAKGTASTFGGTWSQPPQFFNRILNSKKSLGKQLRGKLKRDILRILRDAAREQPRPPISEVSRRIRAGTDLTGEPVGISTKFRAERIARTEMVLAENQGIAEGIAAVGEDDDEIEWIAVTSDRASGDRRHWRMDGKRIKLADMKSGNRAGWFTTPLGNKCRYPGDTNLPIKDRINCRCTHGLRLARKGKK